MKIFLCILFFAFLIAPITISNGFHKTQKEEPVQQPEMIQSDPAQETEKPSRTTLETLLQPSDVPITLFPFSPSVTMKRNTLMIMEMRLECTGGNYRDAKIEILPPTPSFIGVRQPCLCIAREAVGLI